LWVIARYFFIGFRPAWHPLSVIPDSRGSIPHTGFMCLLGHSVLLFTQGFPFCHSCHFTPIYSFFIFAIMFTIAVWYKQHVLMHTVLACCFSCLVVLVRGVLRFGGDSLMHLVMLPFPVRVLTTQNIFAPTLYYFNMIVVVVFFPRLLLLFKGARRGWLTGN